MLMLQKCFRVEAQWHRCGVVGHFMALRSRLMTRYTASQKSNWHKDEDFSLLNVYDYN